MAPEPDGERYSDDSFEDEGAVNGVGAVGDSVPEGRGVSSEAEKGGATATDLPRKEAAAADAVPEPPGSLVGEVSFAGGMESHSTASFEAVVSGDGAAGVPVLAAALEAPPQQQPQQQPQQDQGRGTTSPPSSPSAGRRALYERAASRRSGAADPSQGPFRRFVLSLEVRSFQVRRSKSI